MKAMLNIVTKASIDYKTRKKVSGVIITVVYCTANFPHYVDIIIFSLFP